MRFVSDFSKSGKPEPREVGQASVRFHAFSLIGSPHPYYNNQPTPRTYRLQRIKKQKMEKKEKKIYQSPTMTVYEISRTQILAGSTNGETETLDEEDYTW